MKTRFLDLTYRFSMALERWVARKSGKASVYQYAGYLMAQNHMLGIANHQMQETIERQNELIENWGLAKVDMSEMPN